jgi:inner membrane protein
MELMPYVWAIVGLVLITGEFFIPGFVIFFFGAGALLTTLFTALFPSIQSQVPLQILIWLGASGLSLGLLRRYFAKIFKGTVFDRRDQDDIVGDRVTVTEEISPDKAGRVRYQGTTWKAVSYDESFKSGDSAEIIKKEGMTFIITKSILGEDHLSNN